jgi:hypothetical protein
MPPSNINPYLGFIPTMRAGCLCRSLFLSGFGFLHVRGMRRQAFFTGLEGAADNHFSFIAAILAGAHLPERFFWGRFGHFYQPPHGLN